MAKAKEQGVDFRKERRVELALIIIEGVAVERVSQFRFLGINITEDLKWDAHADQVVKKDQQSLFRLRRLKKFGIGSRVLRVSTGAQWKAS